MNKFNPYEILNIESDATDKEIITAYKKLAKEFHPDNKDTGDPDKFLLIKQAYDLLMSPSEREAFDKFGVIKDDPESRILYNAHKEIFSLVLTMCENIPLDTLKTDLVKECLKSVKHELDRCKKDKSSINKKKESFEKCLDITHKIKSKSPLSIFQDPVISAIEKCDRILDSINQKIKIFD